jgi:hypothetical protein
MIALHREFLLVAQEEGGYIPCSVEQLTLEIAGGAADQVDPEWLRQAAAGVLHYFKEELGQTHVTVGQFAEALGKVLDGLGLKAEVTAPGAVSTEIVLPEHPVPANVWKADLRRIAVESGKLGELAFQQVLRERLSEALAAGRDTLEFSGLRGCVKQMTGRKIWCPECRRWEAWIVDLLRTWIGERAAGRRVALVVR